MLFDRLPRPLFAPEDGTGAAAAAGSASPLVQPPAAAVPVAQPVESAPAVAAATPAAGVNEPALAPAADPTAADPTKTDAAVAAAAQPEILPTALEAGKDAASPEGEKDSAAPKTDGKPETAKPDVKADAKPDEPGKPADGAPEAKDAPGDAPQAPPSYDLKFPEDINVNSVNQERLGNFTKLLGESRVTPEVAQNLLDMHIAEVRAITQDISERLRTQQWDVFRKQQADMLEEIKADPHLGGSRFQTAMKDCARPIEQWPTTPEMRKRFWDTLRATGAGNSLPVAQFMNWLGETYFKEGSARPAQSEHRPPMNRQQRGESRYAGSTPSR